MSDAEQISAAWGQGLRPIEAIHQQNTRTFVGSYDFHLLRLESRWRIDSFRFNLQFLDGNLELEQAE
jgi:hypothetical protein